MKLAVGLKTSQTLALTPQLQQAIRILQLSRLELEQEIILHIEQNPLLEQIEELQEIDVKKQEDIAENERLLNEQFSDNSLSPDLSVDMQWQDVYIHQSSSYDPEQGEYEKAGSVSFKSSLLQQVNLLHLSKLDKLIAYYIVDGIDERGFLEVSIQEIREAIEQYFFRMGIIEDIDDDEILVVLKRIQRLEPLGIASRSLLEYLLLQVSVLSSVEAGFAKLILQHYPVLLEQNVKKLLRLSGLSQSEFDLGLALLKSLPKSPMLLVEDEPIEYQIPDVIVNKVHQRWVVSLNPDDLPKLKINAFYLKMLHQQQDMECQSFLKQKLADAKGLIKNIDDRHRTILRVAQCIVNHQHDFFEFGAEAMKPLVLREIAEELDLHESTVSRTIMNKFLLTPKGLFELKYFFSSQVPSAEGGGHSATAIQALIRQWIEQENKRKPLSDQALVDLLKEQGIDVARRTVAKYREGMNIGSSSQRKVLL